MVEHLAEREVQQRALGIERERALETRLRALDVAGLFLGQRELQQRADVARVVLQQRAKLLGRLRLLPKQREACARAPSARRDRRGAVAAVRFSSGTRVS